MFDIYSIGKYSINALKDHNNYCPLIVNKESGPEDYENNYIHTKTENNDVIIFTEICEDLNGVLLRLLENYNGKKYVVLLLKNTGNLKESHKNNQNIFSHILQEYTRSGLIDRIFLLSLNRIIEKLNTNIFQIDAAMNVFIINVLSLLMFVEYGEPVFGKSFETEIVDRISTIGFCNDGIVSYLYDFETMKMEHHYVVLINEKDPSSNNIIQSMDNVVRTKEYSSYEIHSTEDESTTFVIGSTNVIQQIEI